MKQHSHSNVIAVGHRGCRDLRPENTLAAFRHALELGVDAVECDIHLTKDGKVIVYHDYFLNPEITRTAAGVWIEKQSQPIHTQTFAELSTYKLGQIKRNTPYAFKHPNVQNTSDEPIPTLQDVFLLMKQYPQKRLLIEVKTKPFDPDESSDPKSIAKKVVEEVKASGIKDRCEVLSFDWRIMKFVKQLDSSIILSFNHVNQADSNSLWFGGYDLKDFENSPSVLIAKMGGSVWSAHYEQLTIHNIKQAQALGLKVYAWTVNSEKDMQNLINMGVDAIITDRPDLLVPLVKK